MYQGEDDYRVEALIAFWLENGTVDLDHLTIQPEGTFERAYSKDVLEIARHENSGKGEVKVHISREGLYDMLPEGLFHQARQKPQKSTEEAVEESERYRKEEKAARQFFLPLEQEFYRQRVWLEHTELRTWLDSIQPESESIFLDFWGVDQRAFSPQQCSTLLTILPNLHEVVGNLELTAFCLEKMILEPVKISTIPQQEVNSPNEGLSILGSGTLGVDVVLGSCWWADEPAVEVTVGPVAAEKVNAFLPDGSSYKQLEKLYGYLFPAEARVVTALEIEESARGFKLIADTMHSGRLGYTTEI